MEQTALNGEGVNPMQIQALSFEQLVGTVAVILLLVGVYNTIMNAIKTAREEKRLREQPVNTSEQREKPEIYLFYWRHWQKSQRP